MRTRLQGTKARSRGHTPRELLFREICGSPTLQLPRSLSKIQAPAPTQLRNPESGGRTQPLICNSSDDSEIS